MHFIPQNSTVCTLKSEELDDGFIKEMLYNIPVILIPVLFMVQQFSIISLHHHIELVFLVFLMYGFFLAYAFILSLSLTTKHIKRFYTQKILIWISVQLYEISNPVYTYLNSCSSRQK